MAAARNGDAIETTVMAVLYVVGAVFGVAVIGVWAWLIGCLAGIWGPACKILPSVAIIDFGLSLTGLCAVIWLLNRVGITTLDAATERLLARCLVAGILQATVMGVTLAYKAPAGASPKGCPGACRSEPASAAAQAGQ